MLQVFDRRTGVFTVINGSFKHKSYKPVTSQLQIYFCDNPKSFVIIFAVKHVSVHCLGWCNYLAEEKEYLLWTVTWSWKVRFYLNSDSLHKENQVIKLKTQLFISMHTVRKNCFILQGAPLKEQGGIEEFSTLNILFKCH